MEMLLIVLVAVLIWTTPAVAQIHCESYTVAQQRITDCQDNTPPPHPTPDYSRSLQYLDPERMAEQRERLRILELQRQLLERQLKQQEPRSQAPARIDDNALRELTRECLKSKADHLIAAMERHDDAAVEHLRQVSCP